MNKSITRRLPGGWAAGLCMILLAALGAPASAHWTAAGSGAGSGLAATMPTAAQPSVSAAGRTVTVTWGQSSFQGDFVGAYAGGGYTLTRYVAGSAILVTPNAGCATAISGATATLQCTEGDVPYGDWQYTVTPVLSSFTGGEGAKSTTVRVVPAAPTLTAVTAQNPASGQAIAVALSSLLLADSNPGDPATARMT